MVELMGYHLVDDRKRKANDYEVPVSATMFGGASVEAEESTVQSQH